MLSLCVWLMSFLVTPNSLEVDLNYRENVPNGERLYGELVKKAQSYGDCWKKAMSDLHVGCRKLTEEVQSRLALSFANCFLIHAGLDPCHCTNDSPISDCLKNSDDRVFGTYTEFFTHTHSICHYLQNREWQEEASKTVILLTENSQYVSKKLDESVKSQSQILDLQQVSLMEQKRLLSNGRILKTELQQTRQSAKDIYKEFKMTTDEQKFLIFQVFDRVKNLQNFVLGEFAGVYTVAYYIITAVLIFILTSLPQTAAARIWLILLITFSATLERVLIAHILQENLLEVNPQGVNALLYSRIWLFRKITVSMGFIILLMAYYFYKDYNAINNHLLQEILHQNKELQNCIRGLGLHDVSATLSKFPLVYETAKTEKGFGLHDVSATLNKFPLVYNETAKTEKAGNHESKSNIMTRVTPENFDKENISPHPNLTDNVKKILKKETIRQKKAVKSRGNTPKREKSILSQLDSPVSERYNLRSSSRLNSPVLIQTPPAYSP